MVQKTVNIAQAIGVPGEFYDDSPRRVAPYVLRSAEGEVAAKGTVSFSGNPADGDTVTAKSAGTAGNSVALAATGSAMTASGSTLEGGTLSSVLPTVARVFTAGSADNEAVIGGEGAFRGILVGPKQYANYLNFTATMTLPDGTIGQLATMGHILVAVANAVSPDDVAVYNNVTGEISGIEASGSAPEGSTKIPNSKFILRSAAAGETAVLELTN